MNKFQIINTKFRAEKIALAAHAVLVLDEIDGHEAEWLRAYHKKEIGKHLASLAEECGFKLAPKPSPNSALIVAEQPPSRDGVGK